MKIAYISLQGTLDDTSKSATARGGYNFMCVTTAKQMAERGNEILYLCAGTDNKLTQYSKNISILEVESLADVEMSLPLFTTENTNLILTTLKKFNPAVIHAQEISPLGLLTQKWALENNIPFIITLHSMPSDVLDFGFTEFIPVDSDDYFYKKFKDTSAKVLYKEFLTGATKVIALNNAIKEDIIKYVPEEKIIIIPNGFNLEKYAQIPLYVGKEKNILFSGVLTKRKNQEFLIEAQKFLPKNVNLYLLGRAFTKQHMDKLIKLTAANPYQNTHLEGYIANEKIPDYLGKTKVFVSASKKEVQSISIIEALAAGRPVVGIANETTIELIDDSVGKLMPKDTTPENFAFEVNKILNLDQTDYLKIANNCRGKVKIFAWNKVGKQLEDLYLKESSNKTQGEKTKLNTNLIIYSLISIIIVKSIVTIKKAIKELKEF